MAKKINFEKMTREELVEVRQEMWNAAKLKSDELMKEDDKLTRAYQEDTPTKAIKNRKRKLKLEAAELVWELNQFDKKFNQMFRHENCSEAI